MADSTERAWLLVTVDTKTGMILSAGVYSEQSPSGNLGLCSLPLLVGRGPTYWHGLNDVKRQIQANMPLYAWLVAYLRPEDSVRLGLTA